jgi:fatty-acyl-CoA synthase
MMDSPLLVTSFIDRAAAMFGRVEIVSRLSDRSIHRYTYPAANGSAPLILKTR